MAFAGNALRLGQRMAHEAVRALNVVARRTRPLPLGTALAALVGVHGLGADPFREAAGPLPVEEAFVFTSWLRGDRLVAHWNMPKGYYLYRHRFAVSAGEGVTLGTPVIPRGEPKTDDHFGESEVHFGSVEITVPVIERPAVVAANICFQGCADTGLCYPPQVRTVVHEVSASAVSVADDGLGSAAGATAARDSAESGCPMSARPAAQHSADG